MSLARHHKQIQIDTGPNESTKVHNPWRNQSTGITRIRYTVRCIRGSGFSHARATYHKSVRYGIGTCTTYAIHVLYTVFIRRESDAALDATTAVQGKQP